jgi:hypothetical protein
MASVNQRAPADLVAGPGHQQGLAGACRAAVGGRRQAAVPRRDDPSVAPFQDGMDGDQPDLWIKTEPAHLLDTCSARLKLGYLST